jgi:hypothetical protein
MGPLRVFTHDSRRPITSLLLFPTLQRAKIIEVGILVCVQHFQVYSGATEGLDFSISKFSLHSRPRSLPSFSIRGAILRRLRRLATLVRLAHVCILATLARTLFDMMD